MAFPRNFKTSETSVCHFGSSFTSYNSAILGVDGSSGAPTLLLSTTTGAGYDGQC